MFHIADLLLAGLVWLLLANCVLSWFPASRGNAVAKRVDAICGPLLAPFRAIVPPIGGLDLSPLFAILLLSFLRRLLHAG